MSVSFLVRAISNALVAEIARVKFPALPDGRILIGRRHVSDAVSPRVVFVPKASKFGPSDMASPAHVSGYPSDEIRAQWACRSIWTDAKMFDVHVFGPSSSVDSDDGFDRTEWLYQQVIRSTHQIAPGAYGLTAGTWEEEDESQNLKATHHYTFGMELLTPLLDLPALTFVPTDTAQSATVKFGSSTETEAA